MTSSTDRIEREILLKAPRARVWRALSNAQEFGTWFGAELTGKQFVPGERVRAPLTACGHENIIFDAVIVEMKPEQRFSFQWHPCPIDAAVDYSKEEPTLVVIELSEVEGGTLLRVVESGFDKVPAARRAEAFRLNSNGWEGQLKNIARYVEAS